MRHKSLYSFIMAITIGLAILPSPPIPAEEPPKLGEPLLLSLQESIRLALENNIEIAVERLTPKIRWEEITLERGQFDPELNSNITASYSITPPSLSIIESSFVPTQSESRRLDFGAGLKQRLPTGGNYELKFTNARSSTSFQQINPSYTSNLTLSFTQPLLRDFGIQTTRSRIRIAQNNLLLSREAFRAEVVDLVTQIEEFYWDLVFKRENLGVQQQFLKAAQALLEFNRAKVQTGLLASVEVLVAEAEVASREENVVVAEKDLKDAEDQLRKAINLSNRSLMEEFTIIPTEEPTVENKPIDPEETIRVALEQRPDLHQLKTTLQNNRISYDVAQNSLYPFLDLKASAGLNGLGDHYGNDLDQLTSKDFYSWQAGLVLTIPLGNRVARAGFIKQKIEMEKNTLDLKRLEQDIVIEIKGALRERETTLKRIETTRKARFLAKTKLEAETERYNIGLATTQDLLQFQKDYANAQSNELKAVTDYRKSIAHLERSQGTILERHNIVLDNP
jgi:outer membrane protein TolC